MKMYDKSLFNAFNNTVGYLIERFTWVILHGAFIFVYPAKILPL